MYLNIQSCLCFQGEHYILLLNQANWHDVTEIRAKCCLKIGFKMENWQNFYKRHQLTQQICLFSAFGVIFACFHRKKKCFNYFLVFVTLQAQHNCGRGSLAEVSSELKVWPGDKWGQGPWAWQVLLVQEGSIGGGGIGNRNVVAGLEEPKDSELGLSTVSHPLSTCCNW